MWNEHILERFTVTKLSPYRSFESVWCVCPIDEHHYLLNISSQSNTTFYHFIVRRLRKFSSRPMKSVIHVLAQTCMTPFHRGFNENHPLNQ
jgi:hypothetical protein